MKIYLAGPMTGHEKYNFDAFAMYARELRKMGHFVISPAEMDLELGFDPDASLEGQGFDLQAAFRRDIESLLQVDAIALMPGHEKSEGATLERSVAEKIGLQLIFLG